VGSSMKIIEILRESDLKYDGTKDIPKESG
jgi:hypothetical protein